MHKYERSTKDSERENLTATAHRRAATGMEVRTSDKDLLTGGSLAIKSTKD